eukprot:4383667-Prymnesium_polylepis.1
MSGNASDNPTNPTIGPTISVLTNPIGHSSTIPPTPSDISVSVEDAKQVRTSVREQIMKSELAAHVPNACVANKTSCKTSGRIVDPKGVVEKCQNRDKIREAPHSSRGSAIDTIGCERPSLTLSRL